MDTFLSTPSARRATRFNGQTANVEADFYPRPPRGGRHIKVLSLEKYTAISIHALREEGDQHRDAQPQPLQDFYPRPPRGGRPLHHGMGQGHVDFYPRPPRGGRRFICNVPEIVPPISIHALREEGDPALWFAKSALGQFLSTPSARRATRGRE